MKSEKDDLNRKNDMPKARSGERTIKHETIPGEKPAPGARSQQDSMKEKAAKSTMDEDLN